MLEGDQEVQDAAATCFLENLQHQVDVGKVPGALSSSLLGSESRDYCKAWDEFTGVKTKELED